MVAEETMKAMALGLFGVLLIAIGSYTSARVLGEPASLLNTMIVFCTGVTLGTGIVCLHVGVKQGR